MGRCSALCARVSSDLEIRHRPSSLPRGKRSSRQLESASRESQLSQQGVERAASIHRHPFISKIIFPIAQRFIRPTFMCAHWQITLISRGITAIHLSLCDARGYIHALIAHQKRGYKARRLPARSPKRSIFVLKCIRPGNHERARRHLQIANLIE